jgi:hypothetical protein
LPLVHRVEVYRQLLLSPRDIAVWRGQSCLPRGRRSLARPAADGSPRPAVRACCFPPLFSNSSARRRQRSARAPASPLATTRVSVPARLARPSELLLFRQLGDGGRRQEEGHRGRARGRGLRARTAPPSTPAFFPNSGARRRRCRGPP